MEKKKYILIFGFIVAATFTLRGQNNLDTVKNNVNSINNNQDINNSNNPDLNTNPAINNSQSPTFDYNRNSPSQDQNSNPEFKKLNQSDSSTLYKKGGSLINTDTSSFNNSKRGPDYR